MLLKTISQGVISEANMGGSRGGAGDPDPPP